jgi:hypothetical protein
LSKSEQEEIACSEGKYWSKSEQVEIACSEDKYWSSANKRDRGDGSDGKIIERLAKSPLHASTLWRWSWRFLFIFLVGIIITNEYL